MAISWSVPEQCTGKMENWPKLGVFRPSNFNRVAPKFWTKVIKLHLYPIFWAIKVAHRSSDLEDLVAKEKEEKRKKLLLKKRIPPFTLHVGVGIITTALWPSVWDYLSETVAEETFTHSNLSWSSIILYQYDPRHPPCSIYVPDSLFAQRLSKSFLVYLLAFHPPLHTPYISLPNHCLLFATHARKTRYIEFY